MSFRESNLNALAQYNPYCYTWLSRQSVSTSYVKRNLFRNGQGMLDWRMPSGAGLFEDITPRGVYGKWINGEDSTASATVIIGCNLGYGINEVLRHTPRTHKVIVLEPRAELLMACLSQTDYGSFFKGGKLFFVPPEKQVLKEAASQLDLHYLFGKIRVLTDMPSCQLGPEYAQWRDEWKRLLENLSCDMNTVRQRQDVMIENELKNFARARREGCLLGLRGRADGIPAVLLGAGPSLDRFGPDLVRNRATALYVCGLQVLPTLQRHGFKPDLCMAIDYSKSMERVYETLDTEWVQDIPFIYSCKVQPSVVNAYPGPTLPLWTTGGLGSNLPPNRELVLSTGKGVGTTLVRFLLWCGVKRLLFVGQDFAWFAGKAHADGHLSNRNGFVFDPKIHQKLQNPEGKTIYSTLAYITARRELEAELAHSDVSAFNLYGGGAAIRGARPVDWDTVVRERLLAGDSARLRHFLEAVQRARRPKPWPLPETRFNSWTRSLRAVERRLKRLFKKPSRNQTEIHTVLSQTLFFLRQDPLYQPCLFNEIFDVAGLVHGRSAYGLREWTEFRSILKRVIKRIRQVDTHLILEAEAA